MKLYFLSVLLFINTSIQALNYVLPSYDGEEQIKISRFSTGHNDSPEAFVMESGKLFKTHRSSHSAFFIQHPKGQILIDTGLGLDIDSQFEDMDFWARPLFSYKVERTISDFFPFKIDGVLLSHLHWDHASGLEDMLGVPVHVDKFEHDSAMKGEGARNVYLESQFDSKAIKWNFIKWSNKSYGPFKKHMDFFGDGSLVIVPLYGHSMGSIGFIINRKDNEKIFILGDSVWHVDQIKKLKNKMFMSSFLVDENKKETFETIKLLNKIWKDNKDIKLLPNHHYDAIKFIPLYPKFM